MTETLVYIVFYSDRPMDFQAITELSGVEPTPTHSQFFTWTGSSFLFLPI